MARSVVTGSKRSHEWAKRRIPFGRALCGHFTEVALLTSLNGLMVIIPDSSARKRESGNVAAMQDPDTSDRRFV